MDRRLLVTIGDGRIGGGWLSRFILRHSTVGMETSETSVTSRESISFYMFCCSGQCLPQAGIEGVGEAFGITIDDFIHSFIHSFNFSIDMSLCSLYT